MWLLAAPGSVIGCCFANLGLIVKCVKAEFGLKAKVDRFAVACRESVTETRLTCSSAQKIDN